MGNALIKYLNYTKEAFMLPGHLIVLALATAGAAAATIAGGWFLGLNLSGLFLVVGGLELVYLGLASRSKRLSTALSAKYYDELQAFYSLREVAEIYNDLSAPAQRRFEAFRAGVIQAKENFARLRKDFPDLVTGYAARIDALQIAFVRHLRLQDKLPAMLVRENSNTLQTQIDKLRQECLTDAPQLREVKEKRIAVMEERRKSMARAEDNLNLVEVQLQTLEDTVKFFIEHPLTQPQNLQETGMIDQMLSDAQNLHGTLSEVAAIMSGQDASAPASPRKITLD